MTRLEQNAATNGAASPAGPEQARNAAAADAPRCATPALVRDILRAGARLIVVTGPAGSGKTALLDALVPLLEKDMLRVFRVGKDASGRVSLKHLLSQVLAVPIEPTTLLEAEAARACEILMFPATSDEGTVVAVDDAHTIEDAALRLLDIVSVRGPQCVHPVSILLVGEPRLGGVTQFVLAGATCDSVVETLVMPPAAPLPAPRRDSGQRDPPPAPERALPPLQIPNISAAPRLPATDAPAPKSLSVVSLPAARPARSVLLPALGLLLLSFSLLAIGLAGRPGDVATWRAGAASTLASVTRALRDRWAAAWSPAPVSPAPIVPAPISRAPAPPAPVAPAPISRAPAPPAPVAPAPVAPPPVAPAPVAPPLPAPASAATGQPPPPPPPPVVPVAVQPSPPPPMASVPPPAPVAAVPAASGLTPAMVQTLLSRGSTLFASGDVSAARLLFQRAAAAGNASAATRVGETFDPDVLARIGAVGIQGDVEAAASWYRQAITLGDAEARPLLARLERPAH
jgi:hypothetical protein